MLEKSEVFRVVEINYFIIIIVQAKCVIDIIRFRQVQNKGTKLTTQYIIVYVMSYIILISKKIYQQVLLNRSTVSSDCIFWYSCNRYLCSSSTRPRLSKYTRIYWYGNTGTLWRAKKRSFTRCITFMSTKQQSAVQQLPGVLEMELMLLLFRTTQKHFFKYLYFYFR